MKKILPALINILIIVAPLIFKPILILNYKIFIIEIVVFLLWLTQPNFTLEETNKEKENDKFSVLIILIMSVMSVVVPVVDWAYFHDNQTFFGVLAALAIFFTIIGISIRIWAIFKLGIFFTPTVQIQQNHRLITSGPYALVRHPSYLGAFLCITSAALLLNSIVGFIVSFFCMGIAYFIRIRVEEAKLISHFGNSYKEYQQKTKKIIPYIFIL